SHRRILHTADATGRAVYSTLIERMLEHPNIEVFDDHIIVDLITQADHNSRKLRCSGAYVLDRANDCVRTFQAKCVVLATGGAGKVYLYGPAPMAPRGTASPPPGARPVGWPTWNSTSSTPPACSTPRRGASSSPTPCGARSPTCA